MTEDDIARIDKRFNSLEETIRDGFDRMDIVLANQFGEILTLFSQVNARIDSLEHHLKENERRAEERHATIIDIIKGKR